MIRFVALKLLQQVEGADPRFSTTQRAVDRRSGSAGSTTFLLTSCNRYKRVATTYTDVAGPRRREEGGRCASRRLTAGASRPYEAPRGTRGALGAWSLSNLEVALNRLELRPIPGMARPRGTL
jgi:hypothetical protein